MGLLDAIQRAKAALPRPDQAAELPQLDGRGQRFLLVYLFPRLGDALLLAPVVRALLEAAPGAKIDLLLRPLGRRIWKTVDLPVRTFDLAGSDLESDEARALFGKLGRRHYDYALDLTRRADVDGREILRRVDAKARAGWIDPGEEINELGFVYGLIDERMLTHTHWTNSNADFLAPFGVEGPRFDFSLRWNAQATTRAERAWPSGERPRLLIVPGSADPDKQWPPERFIEIGRWARQRCGASVALTGGPWETELVRSIASAIGPEVEVYTGRDLGTLAALVHSSDVLFANDTGPIHLGFVMDKAVLSVFTQMAPEVWGPPARRPHHIALRAYDSGDRRYDAHWIETCKNALSALFEV